jgi:hypothetical protein
LMLLRYRASILTLWSIYVYNTMWLGSLLMMMMMHYFIVDKVRLT